MSGSKKQIMGENDVEERATICTNGWKRKWRLILLRKDRMYNFNFSCIYDQRGKKHDSWEIRKWREIKLTNKFEVYLDIFETKSKFEVKIVYFFLEGLWNEHFWCLEERFKVQTIRHRSEKKFKTSYQKAILLICYNLSQLLKVRWKSQR